MDDPRATDDPDAADDPPAADDPVQQVRARLAGLEDRPAAGHVAAYDGVHRLLQDALAQLDGG